GDSQVFDPTVSRWVLADGTTQISLSALGKLQPLSVPPDLRGVFLRGVNFDRSAETGDPDSTRTVGSYQEDALLKHGHPIYGTNESGVGIGTNGRYVTDVAKSAMSNEVGGPETRPKN